MQDLIKISNDIIKTTTAKLRHLNDIVKTISLSILFPISAKFWLRSQKHEQDAQHVARIKWLLTSAFSSRSAMAKNSNVESIFYQDSIWIEA